MRRLLVLLLVMACGDRGIGTNERAWLLTMRPVWIAAAKAKRCPRPALRTPATGDGTARLRVLTDSGSAEWRCLSRVNGIEDQLGPCYPGMKPCESPSLADIKPRNDLVEACAPLYAAIEELAHASAACAPAIDVRGQESYDFVHYLALGNAVRLEVAPLVASGQLDEAARRVLDAMRFNDDVSRESALLGAMFSLYVSFRLADTLDEIAIDPRLTTDEARSIARDLDALLATAPRFDAMMRQERASVAEMLASRKEDMVPVLANLDARSRDIARVCSGSLRDCVEHFDDMTSEYMSIYKDYAQRFATRDYALAFVRMQIALRLADPKDCADPRRRRVVLQPWTDRVDVGDECDPVVAPPEWARDAHYTPRPVPRTLHCVAAAP